MKTLFRFSAIVLSFSLGFSLISAKGNSIPVGDFSDSVLTDPTAYESIFSDLTTDTQIGKAALELYRRGVINGYANGQFEAGKLVNRAEALKMILLSRYEPSDLLAANARFSDVPTVAWYAPYVSTATQWGIVNGYANGMFGPDDPVTTAQFLKMLTLTFNLAEDITPLYQDVDRTDWFYRYAGLASEYSLFPGRYSFLLPNQSLTRGEVAVALYQYFVNRDGKNSPQNPDSSENPDENETGNGEENERRDVSFEGSANVASTYVAGQKNALVWEGMFRANNQRDIRLQDFVFHNLGTAEDEDILGVDVIVKQGSNNATLIEASAKIENGDIVLFDTQGSVFIPAGSEVMIYVTADIASTLSSDPATVQLSLDISELDAEDQYGNPILIRGNDVTAAEFTLVQSGSLGSIDSASDMPDSQILLAGTDNIPVAAFEFDAGYEDVRIEDLTFDLLERNTTATLGYDIVNDIDAIEAVSLYYANGSPVLTRSGALARTAAFANGEASFENIDFEVERQEEAVLIAAVSLREISTSDTARSGMSFALRLDTAKGKVVGLSSGNELSINAVAPDTVTGNDMYVMAQRLSVRDISQTQSLSTGPQRSLLRFELVKERVTKDAFLRMVEVEINTNAGTTIEDVGLYNEQNQLIAFAKVPSSGSTYTLTVGVEDVDGDGDTDAGSAGANGLNFDTSDLEELPAASGDLYDEFDAEGIYTIKADILTASTNGQIATTLRINGNEPNTSNDGITWRDGGTNNGEDGATITWIDLGNDTFSSFIENVLER